MDRMLFVAMSGAKQVMQAQEANNHNLANVSTTGFRADLNQFRAMPVFGQVYPTRVYSMSERPGIDFTPGPIISTGNDLDVAIKGHGFIAVQGPDGNEAYTRGGDLTLGPGGVLTTGTGHYVLGNNGPISIPPYEKIEIADDGTITARPLGQAPNAMVVLDRIKLVNPPLEQVEKGLEGLFHLPNGETAPPDASVTISSRAVEGSNANPVDSLVTMINLQRQYEMQVKMMRSGEDNAAAASKLLQLQ
ncbi:flagellar basal-body rod protein FlgF [Gammaproteobacteria bacterium]